MRCCIVENFAELTSFKLIIPIQENCQRDPKLINALVRSSSWDGTAGGKYYV